jgi:hypothetical protein
MCEGQDPEPYSRNGISTFLLLCTYRHAGDLGNLVAPKYGPTTVYIVGKSLLLLVAYKVSLEPLLVRLFNKSEGCSTRAAVLKAAFLRAKFVN